ncbi:MULTISPECIES: LTA synthase family protein [Sphingobacterium]|uniref:Sulfatase-like hydrolase/transferase n=1 Tax=Sphingobacterium tenebrionis TaxID=3111775 RepID=A0ABU8I311_9SPHI|nr:alkaline phosphatase family protein [Sphingobacterium sp. CZ-2]QBR11924.1 alkaline phosphatase family protein [Sphingobacterium sp. CZ-2]
MIKLNSWFGPYIAITLRILGMLIIYAVLRLGFYWINLSQFPGISTSELMYMMFGGIRFDIVALFYINILYILMFALPIPFKYHPKYQKVGKWLFVVSNSIGIGLNLIDYAYYPFTLKRTTGTVFSQFANEDNLLRLTIDFLIDYWYLLIVFVLIAWLLAKGYDLIKLQRPKKLAWPFYAVQAVGLLLVAFFFIGGVRGGWAHSTRPITLSNAGDYVKSPEEMNIVLNTPFSVLKTLKAVTYKEKNYFSEKDLENIYPVIHQPKDSSNFNKLNVVFLILESFGKEHIGFYNKQLDGGNYKGYTPFLDSLITQSYTFNRSYANGRKSIDALPSVITGIPSIGEPFVLSIYSGNKTTSIAKLLGDKGYETAFFHGAPNGSMGFSAYMQLAGIKKYFGKTEYNNDADFDGIWGIWDEPFMQYMANEMDHLKEPFFSSFFSLSSHHPFKVPEQYEGKFPKGTLALHEPIGYADHSLKRFFETAKTKPWYKNTLFVICADHASMSFFDEYHTLPNSFSIPIIFYYPGGELKGMSDKLVQQIDIMPTVLNYLGYDQAYFSFGFDAFAPDTNNFLISNIGGGSYNIFKGDYFMTYDNDEVKSLYNLRQDALLKKNLLGKEADVQEDMKITVQAFIQQYNYRMIHNKLTAK